MVVMMIMVLMTMSNTSYDPQTNLSMRSFIWSNLMWVNDAAENCPELAFEHSRKEYGAPVQLEISSQGCQWKNLTFLRRQYVNVYSY